MMGEEAVRKGAPGGGGAYWECGDEGLHFGVGAVGTGMGGLSEWKMRCCAKWQRRFLWTRRTLR